MTQESRYRALQRLADHQWGVVRLDQILEAGFSETVVQRLLGQSVLHRRFRGIYTYATARPPWKGVLLAAQWSVGQDAYLTGRTALAMVRICGQYLGRIEVAAPRHTVRPRRPPVSLTRTARPPARLRKDGPLRFAPAERAILDLSAQGASVAEQHRLITEAVHQQKLDHRAMRAQLNEHAGDRGVARLTEAYHRYLPNPRAKWLLERSFDRGLAERPWIPEPLRNHYLEAGGVRWELDRYWPEHGLLLELHGGGHHDGAEDLDKDTFKSVQLMLIGIATMAITDTRWELEPDRCLDDLERVLAMRGERRAA